MADIEVDPVPAKIERAFRSASPGDRIVIRGDYAQPRTDGAPRLAGKKGEKRKPIVITLAAGARLIGSAHRDRGWATAAGGSDPPQPTKGDPFFRLSRCEWVRFEGLSIVEAWPTAIEVQDSRNVAFSGCTAVGGRHVFRVRDLVDPSGAPTTASGGVVVEKCAWTQDPRLWQGVSWDAVHDGGFKYLNGAPLRIDNVAGNVRFERNEIRDAYNGIKATADPRTRDGARNASVLIADNRFERVRDNPIEPEGYAYDWHVARNRLVDCHGWFSFDGVRGGYWYVYANRGWFTSRQGSAAHGGGADTHRRGFVFKMACLPPAELPGPIYVFNNSFHLRIPIFGNAQDTPPYSYSVRNWYFHDNAFEWRAETAWTDDIDEPVLGAIEPGIAFDQPFAFAGSLSNSISGWHGFMDRVGVGQSAANRYQRGRLFVDGAHGDFRLEPGGAGRGEAAGFDIWLASRSTPWPMAAGRDIGAEQAVGFAGWPPFEPP